MSYERIRSKFSIKIYKYIALLNIWSFYSDLKHNSHKEKNNLLLSLKNIKTMSYGIEKRHNNSKLNLQVVFLRLYKCYCIYKKIPWIGTNYKHCFRIEITLFTISYLLRVTPKKKFKLVECRTGHVVRDALSDLEVHWFYCSKLL